MDGPIGADVAAELRNAFGERVRFDEPLSRHTSFRIGGPADAWVEARTVGDIRRLLDLSRERDLPLMVFGGGTNVLVADRGVRGIVLALGAPFAALDWTPTESGVVVRAGAAARLKKLVLEAAERGWSGLEFAEGIPGSVGGGLLMNAGAFGGELADTIEAVCGVAPAGGEMRLPRADLRFGYRFFDLPPGFVVTHVEFALRRDDPQKIRERIAEVRRRREGRQPLGLPNAGSIFRNPPGQFAGRLIEAAGLKGRQVGGARVSEHHANFIVNVGDAKAADVKRLIDDIVQTVWEKSAVRLVPEVKLLGDWEAA